LELGARTLEFVHKLLSGTATRQDVVDALEELQVELPIARDWAKSDTCLALVAKIRELEQRRLLLAEAARLLTRFFSGQTGDDETEALRSLVSDAFDVLSSPYRIADESIDAPGGVWITHVRLIDDAKAVAWLKRLM